MAVNQEALHELELPKHDADVFAKLEEALGKAHPDPYPTFTRLRQECSVHEGDLLLDEFGYSSPILHIGGRPIYSVLGYDAVTQVLRDNETFSNEIYLESMGLVMGRNILMMDGDEHRNTRRLLQHAFTRQAMETWQRNVVEPIIGSYIDRLAPRGKADLFGDFTLSLPVSVLHRVLGLPSDRLADFHRWSVEMLCIEFDPVVGFAASQSTADVLRAVLAERRRDPVGDDMISNLLRAEENGEALDDETIIGFLRVLLPAGSETTTRATGSLLVALLTHPEQLELVRRDPSLLPRAFEETLRWEGPVPLIYRNCTRATVIDGVKIPAGAAVNVAIGSANRDETKFDRPDEFDLTRPPGTAHLGFSCGPHHCIGLHMGRMEAIAAVGALLSRLPNLRIDPDSDAGIVGITFRGPASIPVIWG